MEATGKLTNVQLQLLKLFKYELPEAQLAELKNVLARFFAQNASAEMDTLWDEQGWSNETMQEWANEHSRKQ